MDEEPLPQRIHFKKRNHSTRVPYDPTQGAAVDQNPGVDPHDMPEKDHRDPSAEEQVPKPVSFELLCLQNSSKSGSPLIVETPVVPVKYEYLVKISVLD